MLLVGTEKKQHLNLTVKKIRNNVRSINVVDTSHIMALTSFSLKGN